ncbi:MAG: hypothetical protein SGBAC_004600 [Bacillariaceae sp.]
MKTFTLRNLLVCLSVLLLVVSENAALAKKNQHQNNSLVSSGRASTKPSAPSGRDLTFLRFRGGATVSTNNKGNNNFVLGPANIEDIINSFKPGKKAAAAAQASRDLKSAFATIFLGSTVEAFLMHQVLLFANRIAKEWNDKNLVTVAQVVLIGSVVFGSATYGSLIDNGLSAATKQLLSPNEIPGDSDWYKHLKKPSWNPPGWVFPIMWLIISKPTQFAALWKLKEVAGTATATNTATATDLALLVYCIHLSLGDAWNKVFFGLQQVKVGVAVISTFWAVLLTSAYLFKEINPSAGRFMVPTCLWVTVAASLNWSIFLKN